MLVRLMEKLERMRSQLGHDQVYDVISGIFDAGSMRLDVLMREAILNRRSMEDILADMGSPESPVSSSAGAATNRPGAARPPTPRSRGTGQSAAAGPGPPRWG